MRVTKRWWIPALLGAALCPLGRSAAAPPVRPASREPAVRKGAAATLVRLLDDPNPAVQVQAFEGLSRTRPPEAVALLVPMLHAGDRKRVSLAIDLLAGIKTRDAILALLRLAGEDKADVRIEVAQRLCYDPPRLPEVHVFFERQSRSGDARLRVIAAAAMGNMLLPPGSANQISPRQPFNSPDPNALGSGAVPGG